MATARNTRANQMSSMELLWGTRSQPSRGPRPGLSVEKIAATAIEIADEDGIEAVSMQRIAGRLGYTAMSLYRYVPGKEQLIDISYDIALGQPSPVDDLTGSWRTEVTGWVSDVLAVYASHPWLLRINTTTPPLGPNQLAWFDALLRTVSDLGLGDDEMVHLVIFIAGAVRDLARTSVDLADGAERTGVSVEEMGQGYALAMKRFAESSDFPPVQDRLRRNVRAGRDAVQRHHAQPGVRPAAPARRRRNLRPLPQPLTAPYYPSASKRSLQKASRSGFRCVPHRRST